MADYKQLYEKLTRLLTQAADELEPTTDQAHITEAREYISHGEYGLAYESLKYACDQTKTAPPPTLTEAAEAMGLEGFAEP